MINLSKFLPFFIPNVYRACSFFTNLDLFCIDNARVIEKYGNLSNYPYGARSGAKTNQSLITEGAIGFIQGCKPWCRGLAESTSVGAGSRRVSFWGCLPSIDVKKRRRIIRSKSVKFTPTKYLHCKWPFNSILKYKYSWIWTSKNRVRLINRGFNTQGCENVKDNMRRSLYYFSFCLRRLLNDLTMLIVTVTNRTRNNGLGETGHETNTQIKNYTNGNDIIPITVTFDSIQAV